MTAKQILMEAQEAAGLLPTGYKADVNEEVIMGVCAAAWASTASSTDSKVSDWYSRVNSILGKSNYAYWNDEIHAFEGRMRGLGKTYCCLGVAHCA